MDNTVNTDKTTYTVEEVMTIMRDLGNQARGRQDQAVLEAVKATTNTTPKWELGLKAMSRVFVTWAFSMALLAPIIAGSLWLVMFIAKNIAGLLGGR